MLTIFPILQTGSNNVCWWHNLFFEHTDLRILFSVTEELNKIYEWFNANKLSLIADKTKDSLFHKTSKADDLLLLLPKLLITEAVVQMCSVKKVFLENSQISQENTCVKVSFSIKSQAACNFIKKETLAQVLYCEFCEISKNTFSYRISPVATSVINDNEVEGVESIKFLGVLLD